MEVYQVRHLLQKHLRKLTHLVFHQVHLLLGEQCYRDEGELDGKLNMSTFSGASDEDDELDTPPFFKNR